MFRNLINKFKRSNTLGMQLENDLWKTLDRLSHVDFSVEPEKYEFYTIIARARSQIIELDDKLNGATGHRV